VKTFPLIVIAVTLLGATIVETSQGQVRPPKTTVLWKPTTLGGPQELPPPTVHDEVIGRLRVADMQIVLDETRWDVVQKRLGGTIGHSGDASESLEWLCFHGSDRKGRWIFWLQSGEVNGDSVGGFQWRRMERGEEPDSRCQKLEQKEHSIELPIPLQLGMTKTEATRKLGTPTAQRRGLLTYYHEHQETIDNSPFTASNVVEILLRDGVVSAIEGWKTNVN
jgi:hypothetical protein